MSDVHAAGEDALPAPETINVGGDGALSPRDAANALEQYRYKRDAREERAEAPVRAAEPEIPPAQAEEAAAPETDTGETQQVEQVKPPLELPRSWSKDQAEVWAALDPTVQEYLLDQDSKASKAVRQAQNEAAEQRKAIEADRAAMEQARKHYDEALPVLLQTLQQQQQGEFADIKTMADVERLAREDWPRYALWDAQQKKVAAVQQQIQQAQERQQTEFRTKWDQFAKDEDAKFLDAAPELSDSAVAKKVADGSLSMLKDIGFTESDLSKLWNGEASLSLRDHRAQLLIRDALRYRQAQTAAKSKTLKPVPVVQRPGSPAARAPESDIRIQNLNKQFDKTASWKDAAELLIAQRSARR